MKILALVCLLLLSCSLVTAQDRPHSFLATSTGPVVPALPESPLPILTNNARLIPANDAHSFLAGNRALLMTEFAVRQSDALTTYLANGSGMSSTCREVELPRALSRSLPGMMAYSGAVSLGVDGLAALLWRHGHRKLARTALIADAASDGVAVGGNVYCLSLYSK